MHNPVPFSESRPDRLEYVFAIVLVAILFGLAAYSLMNLGQFMYEFRPQPWGPRAVRAGYLRDPKWYEATRAPLAADGTLAHGPVARSFTT